MNQAGINGDETETLGKVASALIPSTKPCGGHRCAEASNEENSRRSAPGREEFLIVTQPAKYYGDYAPRANAVFQGGAPQQFYMEPKNLVYPRTAAAACEPAFDVDLQILAAGGRAIVNKEKFGSFRLPAKSAVQDIFLNLKVTLSGAPPGEYKVQFVVRDLNSRKTSTVTQPITLK